jgi:hypothetical protein
MRALTCGQSIRKASGLQQRHNGYVCGQWHATAVDLKKTLKTMLGAKYFHLLENGQDCERENVALETWKIVI